jgi:hypothetical protein
MKCGLLLLICVAGLTGVANAGPIYNNLSSTSAGTQMPNVRNALISRFQADTSLQLIPACKRRPARKTLSDTIGWCRELAPDSFWNRW